MPMDGKTAQEEVEASRNCWRVIWRHHRHQNHYLTSAETLLESKCAALDSRLEEAGGAFVPVKFAHGNSDHYRAMYFNDNPGHESPRSWFEHGTLFDGTDPRESELKAQPIIAP